ncbi:MAG: gliding motility-associated C-terminal domain-containing protein [Bacteroidia bacterium]
MKRSLSRSSLLLVIIFFSVKIAKAQMVGPNAYTKATNLELGIDGGGGFEGCSTITSPPFPTMHPRSANPLFGFVANPQLDGWATFDGDFFTPGTPENGWGIDITGGAAVSNNCTGGPEISIPGTITNWSHIGTCYSTDWEGDYTSGTNLHFKINYFLQETDLFYTTTVTITNNTTATIPEMFYYRNLDPDNNVEISGDYSTTNTIVSEPGTGCNLAHVSATSVVPASQPQSYLGLAAVGANYRVCYGGFSNRDGSDLWNGIGFTETIGSATYADEAISLSYKIQNLAPGASEVIKFVVILDDASAAQAINNLLYLSYPGSTFATPSACTPFIDTIPTCGASVPISVTGVTVGDYTWNWSPGTGLSSTTGSSVIASPGSTVSYTVTGTPISSCVAPVSFQFVVEMTPGGADPVINAVPDLCILNPPITLTADSSGGTWTGTGITSGSAGTFNPSAAGLGTWQITYMLPGGCYSQDTVLITVSNGSDPTITQTPPICIAASPFNLNAATAGGVWSGTGITDSLAGTFDPSLLGAGSSVISYNIAGLCAATDTMTVTVVTVFDPTITSPAAVCAGSAAFNLNAADPGGTFSGTGITNTTLGTFNPTTAGTFPVIYTISGACGAADTVNVTVNPQANATITPVSAICTNSAPFNLSAVTGGGTWSGVGIISGSAGTFDPSVSGGGTFTITYGVSGACGDTATQTVTVHSLPTPTFSSNINSGCEPLTCVSFFESVSTICANVMYLFGDGDTAFVTAPSHCYDLPGTYSVTLQCTDNNGCVGTITNTNMITVNPKPIADFTMSPGSPVAPGTSVTFTDISSPPSAASAWDFGDPGSGIANSASGSPASHTYIAEGDYCVELIAATSSGCLDTVKYCLIVQGESSIFIPNVFTPNGDGNNDVWEVSCHNISEITYDIYDRWGLKIATWNGLTGGWNGHTKNGKMASDGTYYYVLHAKGDDGKEYHNEGWIQLLSDR